MPMSELRSHWRDWRYRGLAPAARRALRDRKLRAVVHEAAEHVPLYRERFRAAGLTAAGIRSLDDLDTLPLVRRADLVAVTPDERLSERAARAALRTETSSGSTGQPLTVHLDRTARRSRSLRFLRALRAVGYRPGQRVLLVTDRSAPVWRRRLGWLSCPIDATPEQLVRAFVETRPHIVYGFATPLRLLAEQLLAQRAADRPHAPAPHAVLTTAEMLDPTTRRRLAEAFGCPIYDFYGLSEVGLVAAQTSHGAGYRIADEDLLVELIPSDIAPGLAHVIVTDLDALAMPIIRYDTGDLAVLDGAGEIVRIEGRSVDCLRLRDGRYISPYAITCALERVHGLRRYSVVQTDYDTVRVHADVGDAAPEAVGAGVDAALRAVLGPDVRVHFELVSPPAAPAGVARLPRVRLGRKGGWTRVSSTLERPDVLESAGPDHAWPRVVECHIQGSVATSGG